MLPTIDRTNAAANAAVQAPVQTQPRPGPEADKALEAYAAQTTAVAERPFAPGQQAARVGRRPESAGDAQKAAPLSRSATEARARTDGYQRPGQDQAEINFQLTREERDAFINAMSGREKPEDMTEQEQSVLQRAAERVEKLIEEALTRSTDRGERLDKAIKEWYSRLTNGKYKAPPDLLSLIQQAAAGNVDFKTAEAV